jgi:tetratricopeptide (TPR) repeat protein
MEDYRGLAVSTSQPEAIAAVNHFGQTLCRMGLGLEQIVTAAEQYPDCTLVQIYTAAFYLFGQTAATFAQATPHLVAAASLLQNGNDRERSWYTAVTAWADSDLDRAIASFEAHTDAYPRDLAAAKVCEFLYYERGQAYNGERFLRHMRRLASHHQNDPDFLAMLAFALELSQHYDDAVAVAEQALELEPATAWAHHALAHVWIVRSELDAGLRRFGAFAPHWLQSNRLIHCHNAWHLALFHLACRDFVKAQEIFTEAVWGITPELVGEQLDAISFLWRQEMAGQPADPALWKDIATHVAAHTEYCVIPFLSAHFAYALARANHTEALQRLTRTVEQFAQTQQGHARTVWLTVGWPLIQGVSAFALQDYARAYRLLEPIIGDVLCVGGSDAQDELFWQTLLLSAGHGGDTGAATRLLRTRLRDRQPSPLEHYWLGLVG